MKEEGKKRKKKGRYGGEEIRKGGRKVKGKEMTGDERRAEKERI